MSAHPQVDGKVQDDVLVDIQEGAAPTNAPRDPELMSSAQRRNMDKIRTAFASGDKDTMVNEHRKGFEKHSSAGGYIKAIVFGGLDGIVTTFAVVAAAAGAGDKISASVVLVFGIANLLADGFSMGFGEFTSSRAEQDYAKNERAREQWEIENDLEGEKMEMVTIYTGKGMPIEKAIEIVELLASEPRVFLDVMMLEELELTADPDEHWSEAAKSGLVMFLSFVFHGFVPLVAYIPQKGGMTTFWIACALTGAVLFLLGVAKGKMAGGNMIVSGLIMLLNGGIAASLSFGAAFLISHLLGSDAEHL